VRGRVIPRSSKFRFTTFSEVRYNQATPKIRQ
jgi:hypothetical protein